MRGLLIKDAYTIVKQTKVLLLITVIFAVVPSDFLFGYSVFYAAMMPITALAYDERAKWDKFAGMLPYSVNEIVGSKYLMGYISVGIVFLLTIVSKFILAAINGHMPADAVITIVMIMCLALIIQAVNLPLMFWIGVEKGRMLFILLTVVGMTVFMTALTGMDTVYIFHRRKISDRRGVPFSGCLQCDFLSDFEKNLYEKSLFIKKSSSATPFAKPHLRYFFAALQLHCS